MSIWYWFNFDEVAVVFVKYEHVIVGHSRGGEKLACLISIGLAGVAGNS